MVQRRPSKAAEDAEDLTHVPLQAILLADSFATKFRPITLERPKVLLPLVGIPMIDYSLAWLESAGVEEVFVFCCAHSKQVIHHLAKSQWLKHPNMAVTTIESHNSVSAGDAMRVIYERNVIHGDFVLVTGDTISNMSLAEALQEHKDRRKKDNNAVMTMVIKKSKPSAITHQSRLGTDELFMAINPDTNQLLFYEDRANPITLEKSLLTDNSSVLLHNDMQDCYIDICAPEVLSLFTDNFDYQHLRRDFLKGLLVDEITDYKIYTHEIHSNYAARVENFRSYDTISKDIMQRWTYPLVPDIQSFGSSVMKLGRQGMYSASDIGLSSNAQIGPFTLIGNGTTIGSNSKVSNSIIGEGCKIGSNVSIEGSYIWNNVTVEDGCKLKHAVVCDWVVMKARAVLEPGVILSFKVVIGEDIVVPDYSKVSLYEQPTFQDSDEELEYADSSSGMAEISSIHALTGLSDGELVSKAAEASEVGANGAGYIWSVCEGREEEWRHSVAPIPEDRFAEILQAAAEGLDLPHIDNPQHSEELVAPSVDPENLTEDNIDEFEKEVEATFQRAVQENIKDDNVILEVNSLRLSYNMAATDCAGALFYSVMKLAVETPHSSNNELYKNVAKVITTWKKLLKYYLASIDEEIEVILKFEEICSESAKELSPLFSQILHFLYSLEIIQEEAILAWESEKQGADEVDRVFLKQAESFIEWLKNASEEESEEEE
ncbi:translation initiation factor eIF-2B subunit epsilon-like [Chenopodium quinoa]|uniref:translation initiation factor eIF-2B subunit epsilon-like n=1 Tax=Chenopodium quinoa TaxID=63459 RepID=UPI000B786C9B|nr:translation initiation factor eIF-2B subunit epsilon-like [Chenopodium quinoa]